MVAALAVLLSACGGGGGGSPPPQSPPSPSPSAPAEVTVSGKITYDFVPAVRPGGLDYGATEARPARLVVVQFVSGSSVIATTRSDTDGNYSLALPPNTTGFIRARADSTEPGTPGWSFRVVDNTSGNAVYVIDGGAFSTGTAASQRDLHAPSGWNPGTTTYTGERAAAPFAILDTIYEAVRYVLEAEPDLGFPALDVHWSPDNRSTFGPSGTPNPVTGEIGTSFYLSGVGIFLLGDEDNDTEEYDRHVVLHEFGHYLERELGRNDSIGGSHSTVDLLDIRLAFSEGWGSGFAALALGEPYFIDTGGTGQAGLFGFDVEGATFRSYPPGYFAELSTAEIVYDLVDVNADVTDGLAYPFATVWDVMRGHLVDTPALVSIFPLLNGMRLANPADTALIDALANGHGIDPVTDDFGSNQIRGQGSPDELPVYTDLVVNGPAVEDLCSTNEFASPFTGGENKLAISRFLRFTPPAAGDVTITVTATDIPAGNFADPDFDLWRRGVRIPWPGSIGLGTATSPPTAACQAFDDPGWTPGLCAEAATGPVGAVEYVLEIVEWSNTNPEDDPDFPPIGRTCFDITVTQ